MTLNKVNIFTEFEIVYKSKIPSSLKKLLIANGYDNAAVLADITEDDITEIEIFAKEVLPSIIPFDEYEEYFGIFTPRISAFKIVSGHRKILNLISRYFKNKLANDFVKNENVASTSASSGALNISTSSENAAEPMVLITEQYVNPVDLIVEETLHIRKVVKEWFAKNCSIEILNTYRDQMCNMHIDTKHIGEDNFVATIKCIICDNSIKVQKIPTNGGKSRWIYSNFYKHFKKHFTLPALKNELITDRISHFTEQNNVLLDQKKCSSGTLSELSISQLNGDTNSQPIASSNIEECSWPYSMEEPSKKIKLEVLDEPVDNI